MFIFTLLALLAVVEGAHASSWRGNAAPGVNVWCGKAYRPENESFNPGGWLGDPAKSSSPLLDLQIRPRMSIYLEGEDEGSLIVDAPVTNIAGAGQPYNWTTGEAGKNALAGCEQLLISVTRSDIKLSLFDGSIAVNTTSNQFKISLCLDFSPRLEPYPIEIVGTSPDGKQSYNASTELYYLPKRTDGGSVTKLDNLYGGLLVQNSIVSSTAWSPLLPYSYYTGIYDIDVVDEFLAGGYNIIHIVPDSSLDNQTFILDKFEKFLDRCDKAGLLLMYDMRWTYLNASSVEEQVKRVMKRKSLLLYYTGDEPDGNNDPLDATKKTYDQIKSLDPYHPVSLCLNCYNFYYEEYSSGADIILSDVYPIAVNTSFSNRYGTLCNTTYGDCGCDDCRGDFQDVSERFDLYNRFRQQLGLGPKAQWGVPQAFGGGEFWSRVPTANEEIVLHMLSINHLATGIVSWVYPSILNGTTSALAELLTHQNVTKFLLGSAGKINLPVAGGNKVDVTSWTVRDEMLVSVVQADYEDIAGVVSITLPEKARGVHITLYGDGLWTVDGEKMSKTGLKGLEFDFLVLDLGHAS